jgi:hypothetical protein
LSINLEASTSWNPKGLTRPVMGLLYLYLLGIRFLDDLCTALVLAEVNEIDSE